MKWADFWAFYKSQEPKQQRVLLTTLYSRNGDRAAFDDWVKNLADDTLVEILTNAPFEIAIHYVHLLNSGARQIMAQYREKESAQLRQTYLEKRPEFKPKPRRRSKTLVAASWLEELENER